MLENHHASASLLVIRRVENNIFAKLDSKQRQSVRALMIRSAPAACVLRRSQVDRACVCMRLSLILATDLKSHFEIVSEFRRRSEAGKCSRAFVLWLLHIVALSSMCP